MMCARSRLASTVFLALACSPALCIAQTAAAPVLASADAMQSGAARQTGEAPPAVTPPAPAQVVPGLPVPATPEPDPAALSPDELFRRMFGKERPAITAGRYGVIVDGMNAGEAMIDPSPGGWIDGAVLRRIVGGILLPDAARTFGAAAAGERVSFAALRGIGFTTEFDAGQLVLILGIPMAMRTPRILPLNPPRVASSVAYAEQADVSAYVSVRGGLDVVERAVAERGVSRVAADMDVGVNVQGVVAQARLRYDADARRPLSRGDVRMTYDDIDKLLRWELGDLSVARRPYQVAPRIAGVSAYREYRIDPYLDFRASGERGFELQSSAQVEVLVNGAPVRSFPLAAGRYTLRDLPLVTSATNDIEIRITEANGRREVIAFPAFAGIDLLDPGRDEFAINAGIPYRDRDGVRRYDTSDFNIMGFYRRGLSQTLTLGASVELDTRLALVGGEVAWASPLGTLDVNAATDVRRLGPGSSRLALQYAWRDADVLRGRAIDAQLILTGRDFRTLDDLFGGQPSSLFAQVRMGQAFSDDFRVQIGGSYERVRDPRPGQRWSIGGTLTHQFGPVSASASLDWQRDLDRSGAIARVSVFVPLGRGTLSANYTSRDTAMRAEYSEIVAAGVGAFGYTVGAERRDGSDRQFARATYIGNRFEAALGQTRTNVNGRDDIRTGVAFGTALVMADGAVALSRPISNSFAIVENAGNVATRLAIEPRSGLGGTNVRYSAFAGTLGPGVVPDLPPYYERPIEVVAIDAPAGSGVGGEVFMLRPGFRSGYRLKVGAGQGAVSALGVLVDRAGAPLGLISGEVRKADAPADAVPAILFTNAAGRFFVEGLEAGGTYEAIVTVAGRPVRFTLQVPDGVQGIWRPAAAIPLDVEVNDAKK